MTISRSCVTLVVLALISGPAFAENDPAVAVEQVDGPKPKVISAGQDPRGVHAFLAVTPKGPMVFWGPKDELAELDVLSMQRVKGGFLIDTLEEGEILFETGRTTRVIKRGVPGFNSPQPTIVFGHPPDAGLRDEVSQRLGGATTPKSSVAVEIPTDSAHVRFPAARRPPNGSQHGPLAHKPATIKSQAKRLRARLRARGRVR
ncbi:MAG TPA: hypothetical protein VMZ28_10130 [Kofleriaceae bacterium]|nr:hypothetical protein [Kofleriaceae bacterium]